MQVLLGLGQVLSAAADGGKGLLVSLRLNFSLGVVEDDPGDPHDLLVLNGQGVEVLVFLQVEEGQPSVVPIVTATTKREAFFWEGFSIRDFF